jgi:MoxR-like ATPase
MSVIPSDTQEASRFFRTSYENIKKEIGKAVIGQHEIVDQLLISLFSRGHCVLVGVPGLAKTLLIRTVAKTLNLSFSRIQFTPDLMPSDITGTEVIEEDHQTGGKSFKFVKGPIFANIILADEINRTPPKTQAALLEAMQEFHVTASGATHELQPPFFVLATQNPIEQEGTYPLPEAQLDRFMFNLVLDYPSLAEEVEIVGKTTQPQNDTIEPVLNGQQILELQQLVRNVPVPESVLERAVRLVHQTRPQNDDAPSMIKQYLSWGAGPRASQYLILGSKTRALAQGRFNVTDEDINHLAAPVLRHRIVPNYAAEADGLSSDHIIQELVDSTD